MVYFTLLNYSTQLCGQFCDNQLHRIQTLQNKAINITNFAEYKASACPLYRKSKILKVSDIVNVQNFLLGWDCVKCHLLFVLSNTFIPAKHTHNYIRKYTKNKHDNKEQHVLMYTHTDTITY